MDGLRPRSYGLRVGIRTDSKESDSPPWTRRPCGIYTLAEGCCSARDNIICNRNWISVCACTGPKSAVRHCLVPRVVVPLARPGPLGRRGAPRLPQHQCSRSKRSTSPRTTSRTERSNQQLPVPPVAARSWIACWAMAQARSISTRLSTCVSTRSSSARTRRCSGCEGGG